MSFILLFLIIVFFFAVYLIMYSFFNILKYGTNSVTVTLLVLSIALSVLSVILWFVSYTKKLDAEYSLLQQEAKEITYTIENNMILPEGELESKCDDFIVKYVSFEKRKMLSFHEKDYEIIELPLLPYWKCDCGKENDGYFCTKCGIARPIFWTCNDCNVKTRENYCSGCGEPRPQALE